MYTYEKKMPVKNTTRKNPKRSDGRVKENKGSGYYFDDIRVNTKPSSSDVIQRVLFADIPLDTQGKFNYKEIKEMQVWWFMACEWKKQSELGEFTPEKHLKSLRTLLLPGGLTSFSVEEQDIVRLASHGNEDGNIMITDNSGRIQEHSPDAVIKNIEKNMLTSGKKQVDADYCYISRSGLPITREKKTYFLVDLLLQGWDGPTISGVGKTWILNDDGVEKIFNEMQDFKTSMTDGIGFKSVENAKGDFPKLSDYIAGKDVQLNEVLDEIYEKGKIAMGEFTKKVGDICRAKKIPLTTIEGIWGDSVN